MNFAETGVPAATEEIIIELGAEGGSKTLFGTKGADGCWRFRTVTDEGTMYDLLAEDDRPAEFRPEDWARRSDWVNSWDAALALLGRLWHLHVPLAQVHPDFKQRVWAAVQEKFAANERNDDGYVRTRLERWRMRCS